jgi:TetR/AcrR family transcriptional regulator, cholesterol catabolism regulator
MKANRDAPNTRDAIIEASVQLFSKNGYSGTTMRDIAKEVGLLPGSLYSHIDSKETLLFEIIQAGIETFLEIETRILNSEGRSDALLRAAIKSHVSVIADDPQRMRVVFHQWRYLSEPNRSHALEMRRSYANMFTKIINDGIGSGVFKPELDVRMSVFCILGAINWMPEWFPSNKLLNADLAGNRIADVLLSGLLMQTPR